MYTTCLQFQTDHTDRLFAAVSSASANIVEAADAAADTSTRYSMTLSDTVSGDLDTPGDRDRVAIDMVAGQSYDIALAGAPSGAGTLDDPYPRLHDASGTLVTDDDDGGTGYDSRLTFTPTSSGTFHISAGAYDDASSGSYRLSVTANTPPPDGTPDALADYLTHGYWGGSDRRFDTRTDNAITVDLTALTPEGQQLARWAFEAWEAVADITFTEVTAGADILFDDDDPGASAGTTFSGGYILSADVNISETWIDRYGSRIDDDTFSTYIHEIGHALGLGHPGPYDGTASYSQDAIFANDSKQVSVMSYFSQTDNTSTDASEAELLTPMMADILAVQNLYGAPGSGSATAGNTTWGANTTLGGYIGTFFDILSGAANDPSVYGGNDVALTIYDRGGIDTLDLSFSTADNVVRLAAERFSDLDGLTGNLAIARGTVIENAIGGSGSDRIYGNAADNRLTGAQGGDTMNGFSGEDTLDGGNGRDVLGGQAGRDVLVGRNGNDTLRGGGQDDLIFGGNGNDVIHGGFGRDTVRMGNGNDIFRDNAQGGPWGHDDVFGGRGADELRGGGGDDSLAGGALSDTIMGGAGDDLLRGGSQNDVLIGNRGDDIARGGLGADHVRMGDGDDRFIDEAQVVYGNDRIFAGRGDDRIQLSGGDDVATGGGGADDFVFSARINHDRITDYATGVDALIFDPALWGGGLAAGQVVNRFASVQNGDVVFAFAPDHSLTLEGVGSTAGLEADIAFA